MVPSNGAAGKTRLRRNDVIALAVPDLDQRTYTGLEHLGYVRLNDLSSGARAQDLMTSQRVGMYATHKLMCALAARGMTIGGEHFARIELDGRLGYVVDFQVSSREHRMHSPEAKFMNLLLKQNLLFARPRCMPLSLGTVVERNRSLRDNTLFELLEALTRGAGRYPGTDFYMLKPPVDWHERLLITGSDALEQLSVSATEAWKNYAREARPGERDILLHKFAPLHDELAAQYLLRGERVLQDPVRTNLFDDRLGQPPGADKPQFRLMWLMAVGGIEAEVEIAGMDPARAEEWISNQQPNGLWVPDSRIRSELGFITHKFRIIAEFARLDAPVNVVTLGG